MACSLISKGRSKGHAQLMARSLRHSPGLSKPKKIKEKWAGGAVATKVIAAGYMSENFSMLAGARSKGHSVITKTRGSAVRLPISFSKAAEGGQWAVRMQNNNNNNNKQYIYTEWLSGI